MTSREPGFRGVFDQAIEELPLSTVDVDAVVVRERRYQRRRHVLGAANGNPLGKAPPPTQSQVNDLAVGLNLWLY